MCELHRTEASLRRAKRLPNDKTGANRLPLRADARKKSAHHSPFVDINTNAYYKYLCLSASISLSLLLPKRLRAACFIFFPLSRIAVASRSRTAHTLRVRCHRSHHSYSVLPSRFSGNARACYLCTYRCAPLLCSRRSHN